MDNKEFYEAMKLYDALQKVKKEKDDLLAGLKKAYGYMICRCEGDMCGCFVAETADLLNKVEGKPILKEGNLP